jgi:hypothetical protein
VSTSLLGITPHHDFFDIEDIPTFTFFLSGDQTSALCLSCVPLVLPVLLFPCLDLYPYLFSLTLF